MKHLQEKYEQELQSQASAHQKNLQTLQHQVDELKDALKDVYTQNQILNSHNADLEKSIEKSSKELKQKEIEIS